MKELPKSLVDKASTYVDLKKEDKESLLKDLYEEHMLSWGQISKLCNTYPNRVRRDANSFKIKSRSKSEAQSLALETGRHEHPTKGKEHSEDSKIKISESVAANWDNMTEEEREKLREAAKERWENKSDEEIREFRDAAFKAVKKASKEGSILEKYLLEKLIESGYRVDFHKERWIVREKLQIDLFIPDLSIAIEVDGPSHFKNIWGEEILRKNKIRDKEKNGLLLQRGCIIIRIRQSKSLSEKYKRDIFNELLDTIKKVENKRPKEGNRCIILGEKNVK